MRLVNTTKVIQYSGLKRADDRYDAFFLAHLMRLNILPTGYICPLELRGLRDLSRKRMSLVQTRTQQILSIKTQYQRATGNRLSTNELKLKKFELPIIGDANVQMALNANFSIMKALTMQIRSIEKCILDQAMPMDCFQRKDLDIRLSQVYAGQLDPRMLKTSTCCYIFYGSSSMKLTIAAMSSSLTAGELAGIGIPPVCSVQLPAPPFLIASASFCGASGSSR